VQNSHPIQKKKDRILNALVEMNLSIRRVILQEELLIALNVREMHCKGREWSTSGVRRRHTLAASPELAFSVM
jgi:hypothetical protein